MSYIGKFVFGLSISEKFKMIYIKDNNISYKLLKAKKIVHKFVKKSHKTLFNAPSCCPKLLLDLPRAHAHPCCLFDTCTATLVSPRH